MRSGVTQIADNSVTIGKLRKLYITCTSARVRVRRSDVRRFLSAASFAGFTCRRWSVRGAASCFGFLLPDDKVFRFGAMSTCQHMGTMSILSKRHHVNPIKTGAMSILSKQAPCQTYQKCAMSILSKKCTMSILSKRRHVNPVKKGAMSTC